MVMEDLKECPHTVNVRDRVLYRKYLHRDGTEPSETSAIVMDYCSRGMLFRYLRQFKNERIGCYYYYYYYTTTTLPSAPQVFSIFHFCSTTFFLIYHISFTSLLSTSPCLHFRLVQFYFKQLVTALEAMEEKKIIHRDLKPGNIMIAENGELKVIDFGNCVYGEEAKGSCGTEGYLAPEILRGAQYSSKVDIYSAEVILFEMLYGYNSELGIEEKRVFREKSTRWTKWLIKRGVLNLEKSDSAQRLLKYLDGSNIRTPFILIWENGSATKRKACYSTEEAVRILEEKGGGVRYGIYRLTGMELIDAMMEATPENRWDIDDVRGHEFVADAPDYNEEELKGMLDDMDREINRDATLRENERKQKEKLENLDSKKMFRSTGAAGKDDCPFFNVLKLPKLEEDYDGIIKNIEKIGKRVPYRPESALIKCLTMFKYKDDPEETLGRLICIFEKTWKVVVHKDVESYSIRVICDKANFPEVDALLTVFWDEKKEVSIVEFRNLNSSYFEFQNFFEGVRSEYF